MNKGFLFLTSIGLSCGPVAEKINGIFTDRNQISVAIVTTAAEGKENNKYSILAKEQFQSIGFEKIDFIDLETQPETDFSKYQIIYVCGGNTFKLLKFAREAGFKGSIQNLLERDGAYIGVSAGSLIIGPSIKIAGEILPDENFVNLGNLNGFEIIDFLPFPHYTSNLEDQIKDFELNNKIVVERISNAQAILIKDDIKSIIE